MNKIVCWILTAITIFFVNNVYSQKSNYIATSDSITSGVKLIKNTAKNNAQFIRLKDKNGVKLYTPNQISGYGFKDGTVYKTREIIISGQSKKVFLQRLERGKINLYSYKENDIKTYFVEHDSILIQISRKDNYKKRIKEITSEIDWMKEKVRLVKYNGKSLSKFFSLYNNGKNLPLPYLRFGVTTGYSSTLLTIPSRVFIEQLKSISFDPSSNLSSGIFIDYPIEMSYFSLSTGVVFSKFGFSSSFNDNDFNTDVIVNITSANIPLLIRYTFPNKSWRPFINIGSTYSFHLQNDSNIYETILNQSNITINEVYIESFISESMLGYSFGIGIQRNLNVRRVLGLEVRYNQFLGSKATLNKNQFDILTSFSF